MVKKIQRVDFGLDFRKLLEECNAKGITDREEIKAYFQKELDKSMTPEEQLKVFPGLRNKKNETA